MANFTFGFYNAIDNDRLYDAVEMSEIFDGIINDGVYETIGDRFIIKECDYENHSVIVGSGRAWFNHTWNKLEDSYVLTLDPPHSAYDRIDAIVIEVDTTNRTNAIKPVYGIPAIDPVKPEIMNTNTLHQHPLCYITRKSGHYLIEQQYIENVVGTSETPWVIGVVDVMDASNLYLQWSSQWEKWFENIKDKLGDLSDIIKPVDEISKIEHNLDAYVHCDLFEMEYACGVGGAGEGPCGGGPLYTINQEYVLPDKNSIIVKADKSVYGEVEQVVDLGNGMYNILFQDGMIKSVVVIIHDLSRGSSGFTGTKEEIKNAIESGEVKVGTIMYTVDD